MKKGNKYLASFQIYLLVISIISFSLLINVDFVGGVEFKEGDTIVLKGETFIRNTLGTWTSTTSSVTFDDKFAEITQGIMGQAGTSPATGIPTASHGLAGKLIEKIFGPGSTAPQGSEFIVKGKTITASGFGYSASGIVQGAWWALIAYQMTTMIAPMFGLDESQTNAIASAIGWG